MSWSDNEGPTTISAAEAIFKKIHDEGLAEALPGPGPSLPDPPLPEPAPLEPAGFRPKESI